MEPKLEYYESPSTSDFQAVLLKVLPSGQGESMAYLDTAPFYPEGGGQPADSGTIAGFQVLAVRETPEGIEHLVAAPPSSLPPAGQPVPCRVDLARRNDHSTQHTAQHLLSSAALRLLGAKTLSFHLGKDYCSIDLDVQPPGAEAMDALEDEVRRLIADDYRVITHLCPPEDASAFPLRKEPSVETGVLRVVEIDGIDYSACCGTHLRSTLEIGAFRLAKPERYKGGCRLRFVAGRRADADYRRLARLAAAAAEAGRVPEDEVPAAIAALAERAAAQEKSLAELAERLADAKAAALDSASPGPVVRADEALAQDAAALAKALARRGRVGLVACAESFKVFAASPAERGIDVASLYGPVAKTHFGKGGGNHAFFQAAFPDAESFESFIGVVSRGVG